VLASPATGGSKRGSKATGQTTAHTPAAAGEAVLGSAVVLEVVDARPVMQRRIGTAKFLTPVRRSMRAFHKALAADAEAAAGADGHEGAPCSTDAVEGGACDTSLASIVEGDDDDVRVPPPAACATPAPAPMPQLAATAASTGRARRVPVAEAEAAWGLPHSPLAAPLSYAAGTPSDATSEAVVTPEKGAGAPYLMPRRTPMTRSAAAPASAARDRGGLLPSSAAASRSAARTVASATATPAAPSSSRRGNDGVSTTPATAAATLSAVRTWRERTTPAAVSILGGGRATPAAGATPVTATTALVAAMSASKLAALTSAVKAPKASKLDFSVVEMPSATLADADFAWCPNPALPDVCIDVRTGKPTASSTTVGGAGHHHR